MEISDIGKRVKDIRTEVLNLSQSELADKLNAKQVMISRLEQGKGVTMDLILTFLEYLNSISLRGHFLFAENFNLDMLKEDISFNQEQVISLLKEQLEEQQKAFGDIILRVKSL